MGKTLRYSPEDIYFGRQDHRLSRRDVRRTNLLATLPLMELLPPVRLTIQEPPEVVSLIKPGWVPGRETARQPREWYVREQRLDLIQILAAEMLKTSFDF